MVVAHRDAGGVRGERDHHDVGGRDLRGRRALLRRGEEGSGRPGLRLPFGPRLEARDEGIDRLGGRLLQGGEGVALRLTPYPVDVDRLAHAVRVVRRREKPVEGVADRLRRRLPHGRVEVAFQAVRLCRREVDADEHVARHLPAGDALDGIGHRLRDLRHLPRDEAPHDDRIALGGQVPERLRRLARGGIDAVDGDPEVVARRHPGGLRRALALHPAPDGPEGGVAGRRLRLSQEFEIGAVCLRDPLGPVALAEKAQDVAAVVVHEARPDAARALRLLARHLEPLPFPHLRAVAGKRRRAEQTARRVEPDPPREERALVARAHRVGLLVPERLEPFEDHASLPRGARGTATTPPTTSARK